MNVQQRIDAMLTEPAPQRPLWQRCLLPFVGLILFALGIIGWLLPVVPGLPLAILGAPFLLCFHRGAEQWGRDRMRHGRDAWRHRLARWRASSAKR
jgi:uncharacterized membrane protein YbaN (DUF454 family)